MSKYQDIKKITFWPFKLETNYHLESWVRFTRDLYAFM